MNSNYKGDIFYSRDQVRLAPLHIERESCLSSRDEQVDKAITSAYSDPDREIVSDYRGDKLQRTLHCCYDNLSREIVLPCQVILDYITPANKIEELVFVSRSDICRHLRLQAPIEKLLLMTDIHKRTTVEPEYIEFATQDSAFMKLFERDQK